MRKKLILNLILLYLALFSLGYLFQKTFNVTVTDLESVVSSFGIFAPFVYTVLLTLGLSVPMNPLPDYLLVNLAALSFSPLMAIVATFFAHSAALGINYFVARTFARGILKFLANAVELKNVEKLTRKIKIQVVFGMRFILPLTATGIDVVSYAAGFAKLPFAKFYVASIIPWSFISIIFFTTTSAIKEQSMALFFIPGMVLVLASFSIFYLLKKRW